MRSRLAFLAITTTIATLHPFAVPATAAPVVPRTAVSQMRLPGTGAVSQAAATPIAFSMVGFELPHGAEVQFRTSADGEGWTAWEPAEAPDPHGGPDPGSEEAAAERRVSEPAWVGEARFIQVRADGADAADIPVHLVDGKGLSRSLPERIADQLRAGLTRHPAAEAAERPAIVTRAQWGADESLRSGSPKYATARFTVVHHTATRSEYTREEAPAIVRSMYAYHTKSNGWSDYGYNFLVDRFGTIYEGRAGGMDEGVIGAHAGGFNTGSIGVSVIGTYTEAAPPQVALDSLLRVIAWKQSVHGIDPGATIKVTSKGSTLYPSGHTISIPTTIAHRNVSKTTCPGDAFYALMPKIREALRSNSVPPPSGTNESAAPAPEPVEQDEEAVGTPEFRDIDGTVHADAIEELAKLGVAAGCADDRYCPDRSVTRGQMATFLVRASDRLEPIPGKRFPDVTADHIHAGAINAVVEAGIASGFADGTFRPEQRLTRAQMAVFLQRALRLDLVWGVYFQDVPKGEKSFRPRINAIHEARIANGCARSRYCPGDDVSRGQMASFLTRAIDVGF